MKNQLRYLILFFVVAMSLAPVEGLQTSSSEKPGLELTMVAVRDQVKVGSPVVVSIITKNISSQPVGNGHCRATIYNYGFVVKDSLRNPAAETEELRTINWLRKEGEWCRSLTGLHPLKPGETAEQAIDIAEYYDLSRPGQYTIQAQRGPLLKTNVVTVTVLP